jgi:hypothetical protein
MGSTNTTYELWLQFNQSIIDTDDELLIMSVANLEETSEFCDFNFKVVFIIFHSSRDIIS